MRAAVQEAIDQANATLSRPEQIKSWTLLEERLAARRRRADADDEAQAPPGRGKYAAEIDAMYE